MADKIRLDGEYDDMEYEPSDSEEEYTKEEKQLLRNVRRRGVKKQTQEEVLRFESDDDDDVLDNSDLEDDRNDGDIPDSKAWGKKRSSYYYTDFVDQDYSTYNEKDEELALQEEEEAKAIQQRLAQQLDEIDFSLDVYTDINKDDQPLVKKDDDAVSGIKLKRNLENLSERQRRQLFKNDSPEFFGLTQDFEKYLQESQNVLQPFIECIEDYDVQSPIVQFVETMNNIIFTYCTNIAFYLTLKSKRISIKNHPVIKRLVQIRQILQQLEQKYNDTVKTELIKTIEIISSGSKIVFKKSLENLNDSERKARKEKRIRKIEAEEDLNCGMDEDGIEKSVDEEEGEEVTEGDQRRGITYQIAKNKGLTPHRKKDLKNPRVKHRNKYRKALIRRKGAIRTVRKELKRYGGEISGIKATVKKSIKFKS